MTLALYTHLDLLATKAPPLKHRTVTFVLTRRTSELTSVLRTAANCHTHCRTLPHTAANCRALPHSAAHCRTLPHTAAHCRTLEGIIRRGTQTRGYHQARHVCSRASSGEARTLEGIIRFGMHTQGHTAMGSMEKEQRDITLCDPSHS